MTNKRKGQIARGKSVLLQNEFVSIVPKTTLMLPTPPPIKNSHASENILEKRQQIMQEMIESPKAKRRRKIVRQIENAIYIAIGVGIYLLTGLLLEFFGVA